MIQINKIWQKKKQFKKKFERQIENVIFFCLFFFFLFQREGEKEDTHVSGGDMEGYEGNQEKERAGQTKRSMLKL